VFVEGLDDLVFALVHAEGGELEDENVFVFIDDEAAEEVALGVDEAKARGVGKVLAAVGMGFGNALAKEVGADVDAFAGEKADADFGFGVPEADTDEALAMVLYLNDGAILNFGGGAQH
jgi:hypothetical protein